jgi:hypothetical protein
MRLRGVVLGLLVIWAFFATAAFRGCGRQAPTDREPTDQPSLSSPDPSEVSQAYWLAARRVSARCGRAIVRREDFQHKAEAIKSLPDGKRVWAELGQSYSHAAAVNAGAVKELESLPRDRVDPVAVESVTALADYLAPQGKLLRQSGEECVEMAALFAMIHAEGDAFDGDSPKGREYERRESDLSARMKQTVANEGAVQQRRFADLATKARAAATALAKKHGRRFPDLLGNLVGRQSAIDGRARLSPSLVPRPKRLGGSLALPRFG